MHRAGGATHRGAQALRDSGAAWTPLLKIGELVLVAALRMMKTLVGYALLRHTRPPIGATCDKEGAPHVHNGSDWQPILPRVCL